MKPLPLVLLAVLAGCNYFGSDETSEPPALVGTLERHRIELKSEVAEPITEILVDEGVRVAGGTPILKLDAARTDARLAAAAASLAAASAAYTRLVNGPRPEEIDRARAAVAVAISRRDEAQRQVHRARELASQQLGPEADFETREAQLTQAVADVASARARLAELEAGSRTEDIEEAAANISRIEAEIRELELTRARLTPTAPGPAWIERIPNRIGHDAAPGTTLAILLVGEQPFARVYVPEPRVAEFTTGQALDIRIDGLPEAVRGVVRYISAEAAFTPYLALNRFDRSRLTFLMEVDITDPGARDLPTGLPLEVTVPGAAGRN